MERRHFLALLGWPVACTPYSQPRAPEPAEYAAMHAGAIDEGLAAEMRRVPIVMYMTTWCPHCRRARAWLEKRSYSFVMHDVDEDDEAADVLESINPRGAVPTFEVDGEVVFGFDPRELEWAIRRAAQARMSS